jgi:hypothetical protein
MNEYGEKIKELIEFYGNAKGYAKKSHTLLFCEDYNLNYVQWGSYSRGTQKLGIKIIQDLVNIFPNLNLNWFLKDEPNMFMIEITESQSMISEFKSVYHKEISNVDLMKKLLEIEKEVKKNRINITSQ